MDNNKAHSLLGLLIVGALITFGNWGWNPLFEQMARDGLSLFDSGSERIPMSLEYKDEGAMIITTLLLIIGWAYRQAIGRKVFSVLRGITSWAWNKV